MQDIFQKESVVKSVYSRVAVCHLSACNFNNKISIIFRNIFIRVEELNYMEDYMKVMREARANYIETWLHHKCFQWAFWVSLVKSAFCKVTGEVSAFCNSVENSTMHIGIFQKVTLEILKTSILTRVACLQSTVCGPNFLKVFRKFRKISKMSSTINFPWIADLQTAF